MQGHQIRRLSSCGDLYSKVQLKENQKDSVKPRKGNSIKKLNYWIIIGFFLRLFIWTISEYLSLSYTLYKIRFFIEYQREFYYEQSNKRTWDYLNIKLTVKNWQISANFNIPSWNLFKYLFFSRVYNTGQEEQSIFKKGKWGTNKKRCRWSWYYALKKKDLILSWLFLRCSKAVPI